MGESPSSSDPDIFTRDVSASSALGIPSWKKFLLGGAALWVFSLVALLLSRDVVLYAPVFILGGFLVPVAIVLLAWSKRVTDSDGTVLTLIRLIIAFVLGGALALPVSVLLEYSFADLPSARLLPIVGVTEVLTNVAVLWVYASRLESYRPRDGMVFGAAVGFGFAAFETVGLSLTELSQKGVDDLVSVTWQILLRAVFAPFGHGLWIALVGGALFLSATHSAKLRVTIRLVGWIVVAALLHVWWDYSSGIATVVVAAFTGGNPTWSDFNSDWIPGATVHQAHLSIGLTLILLIANCLLGTILVVRMWRRYQAGNLDS
ncbi:MAG: PrsW family intramembrane metalloprotease [Actinobacteria bacterium]|nr:PrsW family intramembrane metalloprotease [Actinomycetota bacterium]